MDYSFQLQRSRLESEDWFRLGLPKNSFLFQSDLHPETDRLDAQPAKNVASITVTARGRNAQFYGVSTEEKINQVPKARAACRV